jgi:hypothetical protein
MFCLGDRRSSRRKSHTCTFSKNHRHAMIAVKMAMTQSGRDASPSAHVAGVEFVKHAAKL